MDREKTTSDSDGDRPPGTRTVDYDVVLIGGAFSGASLALLLKRQRRATRILVVEASDRFTSKVGEATVEVSGLFLTRVLGLYDHLSREHLPKHGLRFWFTDSQQASLLEMSEVGPTKVPRLPSFQLDRAKLDEHLLETAKSEGVDVLRPAKVTQCELSWPQNQIEIEDGEGYRRRVSCRWLVDASGRQAFLARRMRLLQRTEDHPVAAAWARWQGVEDLDRPLSRGGSLEEPALPAVAASRRLATNHFCGYGWWCWVIPLLNRQTSIGLVFNKKLFEPPGDGSLRERYVEFVRQQPGLRELLGRATPVEGDCLSYSYLPYSSSRYMDRGWALVGDAASFIDPFYSPGLDHAAASIYATSRLLLKELAGELDESTLGRLVDEHNLAFTCSYRRWLEALYLGKYELMGDAELLSCAYLLDTAFYFFGMVTPISRQLGTLAYPPFGAPVPQAKWASQLARAYNRRLQRLATLRRQTGLYGRRNRGWRLLSSPFGPGIESIKALRQGTWLWAKLELRQLAQLLLPNRTVQTPASDEWSVGLPPEGS